MKIFGLTLFVVLITVPSLISQDTGSGLDFLNIGPSAGALSLSEATTAALYGPSSIYSNPSLLVWDQRSSVEANYTLWISDVNNQFAAFNFIKKHFAYAFGVYNSSSVGFEARDSPGSSAGSFSVGYLSLAGALAYHKGPFAIGFTAQYLREEVFQFIANGYAITGGVSARVLDDRITAGLSVNNLGKMESLDQQSTLLPSSLNMGLSVDIIEFTSSGLNDLPILVSLIGDWKKPIEERTVTDFVDSDPTEGIFTVAANINAGDLIHIQSGYRFGPTERPFSVGMGLIIDPIRVNYALVPFSTGFGTVHSFGVQYYF